MKKMSEHREGIKTGEKDIFCLRPPLPIKLQLELNETCNHRCVFCPFHSNYLSTHPKYGIMDVNDAKWLLESAYEAGIGLGELGLFASGEPFLYNELETVIYHAKHLGFPYVYLTTNGSLVTKKKAKGAIDAGIDSIRFSVNAGCKESYLEIHGRDDFERVIENIIYLCEYKKNSNKKVNTSISFVQTSKTQGEDKLLKAALSKYVDEIIVFDAEGLDRINSELAEKYEVSGRRTSKEKVYSGTAVCASIFNTMYIDSNLNMDLCCVSQETKIPLARDISDLESAWYCDEIIAWRKKLLQDEEKPDICKNCYLRMVEK